jgi:streptogramin lyase
MGKAAGRTGSRMAALSVLLSAAVALGAAQAQAVTIHEVYAGLIGTAEPNHIAAGADGNLWVTGHNEASIDRITPAGVPTEFFTAPHSNPEGITPGPNGKLWFTEPGWDRVGRISLAGSMTEFASDGITGQTGGIVDGPEGSLWFTQNNGTVGRITTLGAVTQFSAGITQSNLHEIAVGPDGNLWFTEESMIGRITPAGVVTEFSEGITPGSGPHGIAAGSDGNLWFTERTGDRIGRITPAGVVTEFSQGITPGGEPYEIAAGPDGNLWYTERTGDRIGRITPAGVVTEFSEGIVAGSHPSGITAGPEDSMWFTGLSGEVGQVQIEPGVIEPSKPPAVVTGRASAVTYGSARLNATVNPSGATVSDCHFEYGASEAYDSSLPCASLPGGASAAVAVSAYLPSLGEHTLYHFRIVATNAGGTSYGADQTFTTNSAPPPPPNGMLVGVNAGGWGPEQYADVKEAVSSVRVSGCSSNGEFAQWAAAGVTVIDDITGASRCGPYDSGGVAAINVASWVAEAVAQVKANPTISAVEVLNEPGGEWYWGPEAESTANAAAYANLLKAVHEAFVQEFGSARPLILASYDGGHDDKVAWGQKVWNEATNGGIDVNNYVDGVTIHPYGGTGERAASALGDRATVQAANAQTGKPVYVTEVGWSTAAGLPLPGVSFQWPEEEQAANIYNFITWARSTGYVAAVMVFNYRDYGSEDFYGIERWGNPAGPDGSRKPAYTALREAAAGLPFSLE